MKHILSLLAIVSFPLNADSQLWNDYKNSADSLYSQKLFDKAGEYYYLAKEELLKDSAGTYSYARICGSLANAYAELREFEKAETLYLEAISVFEKVVSKKHPKYTSTYFNLALLYGDMNQFKKAEVILLEIKNEKEEEHRKDSLDYASICNSLGILYSKMGEYDKVIPLYIETKRIREKNLGKENRDYASICNNLGGLYFYTGAFEKAESLFIEAKTIRAKVMGTNHPEYLETCNNLGSTYWRLNQFQKAEPLLLEAKRIRKEVLGEKHFDYAASCNNLGGLYIAMGLYIEAEPLLVEAKLIVKELRGTENSDYAARCINLAALYRTLGQFEKAENLYLEGKTIIAKVLTLDHPDYANSCNGLAIFYQEMGQFDKAQNLFIEAKQILKNKFGNQNYYYAVPCVNLANNYVYLENFEKALDLMLEVNKIMKNVFGNQNLEYASSCNNLGALYKMMGKNKEAEVYLLTAKHLRDSLLGKEHLEYAETCANLSSLYEGLMQFKKAESLILEAKVIRQKVFGQEHSIYSESCDYLATLYRQMGKFVEANNFYLELFRSNKIQLEKVFKFTSEVEKQSYLKKYAHYKNSLLSFYTSDYSHFEHGFCYDLSLASRNLIISSSQKLKNDIYFSNDTSIQSKHTHWINLREQLSFWHTKPIADRPAYVNDMEDQANTLEKELTVLLPSIIKEELISEVTWKSIQQILKVNEAAIEFVEFNYNDGKRSTDSSYYIALVLRKDKPEPVSVKLFEKKELDLLLNSSELLKTENRINTLYWGNTSIYNLCWKPLEKYLSGIEKIYFASAGNLFKISFAALPVNNKQVLSDKYQLVQLNTTATVGDQNQTYITSSDSIILYGGVQYDVDSSILMQAASIYKNDIASSRSLPEDLTRGGGFNFLPGTLREVETIKKLNENSINSVNVLSGISATEESVKALNGKNSPSVLHIATHGFFFPDPKEKSNNLLSIEGSGKVFKQSDNPLFRSGLLFAGANNAWKGNPIDGIEDGILTAYDVSNIYLPNTKLVVLSACESALGDVQGSEGVYGLQRSFKIAGAQNLVMSLWKVPDAETSEFMQLFYKNMFAQQSVNDAFNNTQTIMKNKYRNEPFKWAAWVLVR